MSLGIVYKGTEGIVLAADSRVTLLPEVSNPATNQIQIIPAFYDNATKLLRVNGQNYVGAVTYGMGVIINQNSPRTAHSYLPEFEAELSVNGMRRLAVEDFATRLGDFFLNQWKSAGMPMDEVDPMFFLVGGHDANEPYGRVFEFNIPFSPKPVEVQTGPNQFGMVWGGQREFIDRIISGYDPNIPYLVQEVLELPDEMRTKLEEGMRGKLELNIPYPALPLQDSVDLAILLIRTTAAINNKIMGIRGVGGPIDVATITRRNGFQFVQQKTVTGESSS